MKTQMTRIGAELSEDGDGPPLSTHEVAARSGQQMSANTVSLLLRGVTAAPSDRTIAGLAAALDVSEDAIRQAVRAASNGVSIQLPKRAAKLSPAAWSELLTFLDYLLSRDGE